MAVAAQAGTPSTPEARPVMVAPVAQEPRPGTVARAVLAVTLRHRVPRPAMAETAETPVP